MQAPVRRAAAAYLCSCKLALWLALWLLFACPCGSLDQRTACLHAHSRSVALASCLEARLLLHCGCHVSQSCSAELFLAWSVRTGVLAVVPFFVQLCPAWGTLCQWMHGLTITMRSRLQDRGLHSQSLLRHLVFYAFLWPLAGRLWLGGVRGTWRSGV
jgi:hypothetical protein